jgi:hypothetical protein
MNICINRSEHIGEEKYSVPAGNRTPGVRQFNGVTLLQDLLMLPAHDGLHTLVT